MWHFHTWHDFFAMGGQATFVWLTYGVVIAAFVLIPAVLRFQLKKILKMSAKNAPQA